MLINSLMPQSSKCSSPCYGHRQCYLRLCDYALSFPFPLLDLIHLDNPILLLVRDSIGALVRRRFDIISEDAGNLVGELRWLGIERALQEPVLRVEA
jgi:hypothetical protein